MALSDRTVNNLLAAARVASNTDVAAAQAMANQLDQRHVMLQAQVVVTALTAGVTYRFCGFVADRAYKVISARFMGPSLLTASVTNYPTINVVANNDAGGTDTILASLAVTTTATAANQSTALVVTSTNTIASAQQVDLVLGYGGSGGAFNASAAGGNPPYVVDLVVQEV